MRAVVGPSDRVVVVGACPPAEDEQNAGQMAAFERRVVIGGAFPTRRAIGMPKRRRRTAASVFDSLVYAQAPAQDSAE
ncbi:MULTISPECIES: hypothetical protein [unclassified Nocardia]|uniref:hypothetical protein n=1 Tax=unclassified Nocardia TaxID=2637762 RepID=UPI001CE48E1C|nr:MULTISPECIES: hypothetical protein [unclassified Nocardia]